MSQQLQITGGAKVRSLEGVITGTSGVLGSLPINASNGIPQLDVNGKILVSQLPNSVMEYQGTWNVVTNTPYLVNGVGNPGDVYIVTNAAVGGTNHNFGAGNILFYNGDQTIYDGSAWQRASGSSGTVTSVAVTPGSGVSALSISGSPITTSGTITIDFAGTNSQYVTGSGGLTTFPSLTGFVPYTGATNDLNLGTHNLYANNFFDGFTNVAASGTQIVLTIASTPSYTITGSGGQTIKLPDATTLPNGAIFSFNNNQSSGAITINNNSNTLVVSVPSGGFAEVVLLDNSIAAGSWDRHFKAPSNVSWSTNTLDYAGSITSATWNGNVVAINRGGTGSSTQNFVDLTTTQTIGGAKTFTSALTASSLIKSGGTSSQFLKADGSVDSSSYITLTSLSFAAGSGAYNNTTGVITIPTNNNQITNGAAYITLGSLSATSPLTYNSSTGVFAIPAATSLVDGYLTSTNFSLFYNKQSQISLTVTGSSGYSTFTGTTLNIPTYTLSGLGGQPLSTNLTSVAGLTYASTSFVKMTAAGTFALDTNTYALASALSSYLPLIGGTLTGNLIYNPGDAVDWYIKGAGNGPMIRLKYNIGGSNRSGALGWMDNVGTFTDVLSWTNGAIATNVSISGTSATFSSNVLVGGATSVFANTNRGFLEVNGTSQALLGLTIGNSAKAYFYHDGTNLGLKTYTGNITFDTSVGTVLTLASTGAATFSSNVTALSLIKSGGTSSQFLKADGSVDSTTYGTITSVTGTTPVVSSGGTAPAISMAAATGSVDGYLTAANFTIFTNKLSLSGGTLSGDLIINGATNEALKVNAVQPLIGIYATGATNTAGLAIYPSTGYEASIGNYRGGSLNLMANSTKIAQINATGYNLDVTGTGRFSGALTVSNLTSNIYIQSSSNPTQLLTKGTNTEFWVDSKYGGGTARAFINRESNGNQATLMFTTGIAITNGTAWGGTGADWSMGMTNEVSNNFYIAYGDLYSSANRAITINSSKNVGIGTSSPTTNANYRYLTIMGSSTGNGGVVDLRTSDSSTNMQMYVDSDGCTINAVTAHPLIFDTNSVPRMRITSAGYVLINQTSALYGLSGRGILEINGSDSIVALNVSSSSGGYFYANASDTYIANNRTTGKLVAMNNTNGMYLAVNGVSWIPVSSDIRKKKNFETTQGLSTILQIEPVKYHFLTDDDNSTKRLGFKAQNIQPLIPEMVLETGEFAEDGSPFLTITPDYILPVLVKAIQEQQAQIEELKQQVQLLLNK